MTINNVTKKFGGLRALNKVNVEVKKGEILGLIGPNGSGKTTLFNVISGFYPATEGTIEFKGENITNLSPHKIARKGIGRTFQIVRPFGEMTVLDNVLVSGLFSGKMGREQCRQILKTTRLIEREDDLAEMLNLAEKRRLEIARALALSPEMLLLDESMAGLTHTEVDEALKMISGIRSEYNLTIILVEHVMRAIMAVSERIVVLSEGKKLAEGSPKEVSENEEVLTAYLGRRA
ncbi:ABC transporter ATP-binding protein [Candidatus Bathyarchaeota archaeon]|jgi:branched-chain amino acid transport system ATP-binding protein|nr:ABC transporter ATP-binding protein [Candidatus Bathyarchaeota archaeon]